MALQLHLEDIEDRSCRNNLQLRGIPEDTDTENLGETVKGIFRTVLEDPDADVMLDREHSAQGPRCTGPTRPRNVVCLLHRYTQKKIILRHARDRGDVEAEGSQIRILPDLSRATLRRRAIPRPLVELAKQKDLTYHWGYPFAVAFHKHSSTFTFSTLQIYRHSSATLKQTRYRCRTGCRFSHV